MRTRGKREIYPLGIEESEGLEKTVYAGVPVLWPFLIPQVGLLRFAASFISTSRKDQSNLYLLEHSLESALTAVDQRVGRTCFDLMSIFSGLPPGYFFQFISECSRMYVFDSGKGRKRFSRLPEILRRMSPVSAEYTAFADHLKSLAEVKGCDPHLLHDKEDWPEFKW